MGVRTLWRVFGVGLVLDLLIGCSRMDQSEIDRAQTALDQARAAGAETYAPAEFKAAVNSLEAALAAFDAQTRTFVLFRDEKETRAKIDAAVAAAREASGAAVANRQRIRVKVEDMMVRAQTALVEAKRLAAWAKERQHAQTTLRTAPYELAAIETVLREAAIRMEQKRWLSAQEYVAAGLEQTLALTEVLMLEIENESRLAAADPDTCCIDANDDADSLQIDSLRPTPPIPIRFFNDSMIQ